MKRRTLWMAGAGMVAAAGGAYWSWQRHAVTDDASAPTAPGVAALWALRLARPGGGELALGTLRGRPLVVNFWATWCPPCIKEMPELDRFARTHGPRGWQVAGIAIDTEAPVQAFLKHTPVSFPIGLAGPAGTALVRPLGNAGGGLPFTVVLDRQGAVVRRALGATDHAQLAAWAAQLG